MSLQMEEDIENNPKRAKTGDLIYLGTSRRERDSSHYISSFPSLKKTLTPEDDEKISEEEAMPTVNLPEVIIAEIISRLPVKSLLRFRCVCRVWCDLITDPVFVKMHLTRSLASNSNPSLMVQDLDLYFLDLDAYEQLSVVKLNHPLKSLKSSPCETLVLGYCNGLLCIANSKCISPWIPDTLFLWNRSTRRHQKLPITRIEYPGKFINSRGAVFGFGHDPTTDDYKVVRVVQFDGIYDAEVKVYSLSTNSWRRIGDMPFHLSNIYDFGFLANSALHWPGSRRGPDTISNFIVSFDLKDEKYREVPLPDFVDDFFQLNLGVLGGQLCVLCNFFELCRLEIWVMKDYGVRDSWVKQFSIEKCSVLRSFHWGRPICYSKNGNIILETNSNGLVLYDPHEDRSRYLPIHGIPESRNILGVPVETCMGSLVPLNAKDGNEQARRKKKKNNKQNNIIY